MFETRTLNNGTRLLLARQADAQSAAAMVMFAAGSRYEKPPEAGIAHFAEHLFFKGTERRPTARDISFEVDSMGADFNAFTGKEYTGYYIKCTREQAAQALDVLADMLFHSRFDPDEIEREKGVIVEEMNMYLDTPMQYLPDVYDNLCFGDTPLGRPIIGNKDTIRAATRDTFTGYLDRWYAPERTFVGLGGGLEDVGDRRGRGAVRLATRVRDRRLRALRPRRAAARAAAQEGLGPVPPAHRRRRPADRSP